MDKFYSPSGRVMRGRVLWETPDQARVPMDSASTVASQISSLSQVVTRTVDLEFYNCKGSYNGYHEGVYIGQTSQPKKEPSETEEQFLGRVIKGSCGAQKFNEHDYVFIVLHVWDTADHQKLSEQCANLLLEELKEDYPHHLGMDMVMDYTGTVVQNKIEPEKPQRDASRLCSALYVRFQIGGDWAKRLSEQYYIEITEEQARDFLDRNVFLVVLAPDDKKFSAPGDGRPRNAFKILDTIVQVREFCNGRTWNNTEVVPAATFRKPLPCC